MDWSQFKNFTKSEFDCRETGENEMDEAFVQALQLLRFAYGKPMVISSGFRSVRHSAERNKIRPGAHTRGVAADVLVHGSDAFQLVRLAMAMEFTGIGIQQSPFISVKRRFVHLDLAKPEAGFSRPIIWSYA